MKILAVDDDPVVLDLLRVILEQEGVAHVSFASSGLEAIGELERAIEPFDLLLLDIDMPGMDGVSLCREIRRLPGYAHTPVVMLTARSDCDAIESAFTAGANDYITKPFDVKGIGTKIKIARRMMSDRFKAREAWAVDTSSGAAGEHAFAPHDASIVSGLDKNTDVFSLGNYLSTMERCRIDETSVFAAKVLPFERLYQACTTENLTTIIEEAWKAIAVSINPPRLLGAYVGSGEFIAISACCIQDDWIRYEQRVQSMLETAGPLVAVGMENSIAVALGRPFRPNASKTKRVKPTFDRACALLHKRLEMDDAPDVTGGLLDSITHGQGFSRSNITPIRR